MFSFQYLNLYNNYNFNKMSQHLASENMQTDDNFQILPQSRNSVTQEEDKITEQSNEEDLPHGGN